MSRVYLDTNFLVDFARGRPGPHLDRIQSLMQNFVDRVDTAIITSFVVAELRTAIRKELLVRRSRALAPGQTLTPQQKAQALSEADALFNDLIERLLRSRRIIQLRDPTHSSTVTLQKALDIIEHHPGEATVLNHCRICGNEPYPYVDYRYLSAADALHVSCAMALNCEIFATSERSFRDLNGAVDVGSLDFNVID